MANRNGPRLDTLLQSSEALLKDLGAVDRLIEDLPDSSTDAVREQIRRRAMESVDTSPSSAMGARAVLHVAENGMQCTATLFPDLIGHVPLELQKIYDQLAERNIWFGIRREVLDDAVFRCNADGVPVHDIVVAEGREPISQIDEHITIEARLLEPPVPIETEASRVEYKERSPFIMVKAGEMIATRIAAQPGVAGSDIYGTEISPRPRQLPSVTAGENTVERDGELFSTIDGRFIYDGRSFSISAVLDIPGDVDYSTGHINFTGDVFVRGNIQEGFNVKATGSLYCAKTISASEIECGKDLVVGRGIIGRRKGRVKVGGDIKCKYIEHCYVEAKGTIQTVTGTMNSVINTLSTFETGPRGIIVGGSIHAQNGVVAGQIGTQMGPATEIYCGTDYSILNRLEWIRDRNVELATKLTEVRKSLKSGNVPNPSLEKLESQLRQGIGKMNDASIALVAHLDKNEDATVQVREVVHPNSYVEICHASYVVGRILRKPVFRLNREKGTIVVE